MGKYKMKVVNTSGVSIYPTADKSRGPIGFRSFGSTFISDQSKKINGVVWYREAGENKWSVGTIIVGKFKTVNIEMIGVVATTTTATSTKNKKPPAPKKKVTSTAPKKDTKKKVTPKKSEEPKKKKEEKPNTKPNGKKISTKNTKVSGVGGNVFKKTSDLNTNKKLGIPRHIDDESKKVYEDFNSSDEDAIKKNLASQNSVHNGSEYLKNGTYKAAENFFRQTKIDYPKLTRLSKEKRKTNTEPIHSGYIVDYSFTIDDKILQSVERAKKNLNIPTAYSRNEINNYSHKGFNRFRMDFPDLYLKNTMAVIFFTRPDLNLFESGSAVLPQIKNDPRDYYILVQNRDIGKLLTANGGDSKDYDYHNFNPLLSNMSQSLEIQDDSVDTVDMGETFTGYKMQYAKHNIKSITAGQLNIKFKETYNLAITNMHQLWVDYQSNVYKGIFVPKTGHIWAKELDYACNIYYFLLDQDGETIRFWSKYYGCFPVNVPKSSFSFDSGSQVNFPELSVTYNYIYKSDLSPRTLVEFNNDSGNGEYEYLPVYAGRKENDNEKSWLAANDHSGSTWVGVPYVQSFRYDSGIDPDNGSNGVLGLKLRYRKPKYL